MEVQPAPSEPANLNLIQHSVDLACVRRGQGRRPGTGSEVEVCIVAGLTCGPEVFPRGRRLSVETDLRDPDSRSSRPGAELAEIVGFRFRKESPMLECIIAAIGRSVTMTVPFRALRTATAQRRFVPMIGTGQDQDEVDQEGRTPQRTP